MKFSKGIERKGWFQWRTVVSSFSSVRRDDLATQEEGKRQETLTNFLIISVNGKFQIY